MALTQQPSKWARPSPTIRVGVLGLFAAFLLVLPLALAPRAEAFIYWSGGGAIGRANLDGTGVDESFIGDIGSVGSVAVDGNHVYWTNPNTTTIGRADLDGANVDDRFITLSSGALLRRRYRGRREPHLLGLQQATSACFASSGRSAAPISTGPGWRRDSSPGSRAG